MSETRTDPRNDWRAAAAAWAALVVALVCLVALAVFGPSQVRFVGALALSAAMLATLAFGLARVAHEPPLLRLTAGAALMFLALMALLSFADLLTRSS